MAVPKKLNTALLPSRRRHWRNNSSPSRSRVAVHKVFQLFAGLEERNLLCWNLDTVARLRIASDAGLALPGAETAEAADFDLVSGAQRPNDAVENSLDDHFAV